MTPCTTLTDQLLDFRDFLQCGAAFEILTDTHRPRHWPDEVCGLHRGKESRTCTRLDTAIWVVESVCEYRKQREWARCVDRTIWDKAQPIGYPWEAGVSFNSSVLYLDPPEVEK